MQDSSTYDFENTPLLMISRIRSPNPSNGGEGKRQSDTTTVFQNLMGRRDDINVQQRAFTVFQVISSQMVEQSLTSPKSISTNGLTKSSRGLLPYFKSNLHKWNNKV